jgi:hypothetical protein
MLQYRTAGQIEAEFIALKRAAERAGSALGCSFGSAAEFEADVIRSRVEKGLLRIPRRRRRARHYVAALTVLIAVLAWALLVF